MFAMVPLDLTVMQCALPFSLFRQTLVGLVFSLSPRGDLANEERLARQCKHHGKFNF